MREIVYRDDEGLRNLLAQVQDLQSTTIAMGYGGNREWTLGSKLKLGFGKVLGNLGLPEVEMGGETAVKRTKEVTAKLEFSEATEAIYRRVLQDLSGREALYTDAYMREALRETLDALAPDTEVEKMPGYKLEENARRPTMRQKAKYILKNREMVDNQASLSESAVENIENAVSGITRSVYVRSNVSTHTPTSGPEVARLHGWVRLVMCDLLSLPIVD
jgi:hypothetical protein